MKDNTLSDVFEANGETQGILIEAEVSSDLHNFVDLAIEIARADPGILDEIDHDLDIHGINKKADRQADRRFFE